MANKYVNLNLTTPSGDGSSGNPWGWDEWVAQIPSISADTNLILYIEGSHQYSENIISQFAQCNIWASTSEPWRINCTGYDFTLSGCQLNDGIIVADNIEVENLTSVYAVCNGGTIRIGHGNFGIFNYDNTIVLTNATIIGYEEIVIQNTILISNTADSVSSYGAANSNFRESYTNRSSLADLTSGTNWIEEPVNVYNFAYSTPPTWTSTYYDAFRLSAPVNVGPWWAEGGSSSSSLGSVSSESSNSSQSSQSSDSSTSSQSSDSSNSSSTCGSDFLVSFLRGYNDIFNINSYINNKKDSTLYSSVMCEEDVNPNTGV